MTLQDQLERVLIDVYELAWVDPEQQQQLVACPVVSTGGGIVETLEVIDAQWYY
jgi:hypothetical protein